MGVSGIFFCKSRVQLGVMLNGACYEHGEKTFGQSFEIHIFLCGLIEGEALRAVTLNQG